MTKDAGFDSLKSDWLLTVLEEEFPDQYDKWLEADILRYEVINLAELCDPVFEAFHFSETNEDDRFLRYAVIGTILTYLEEEAEKKPVRHGL